MDTGRDAFNQPAPLPEGDLFARHRAMQDTLRHLAPGLDTAPLHALGRLAGSREMQVHARLAHVHGPQLHTHDRFGHRVDAVEFHPSYHALMAAAVSAGLHGAPWAGGSHLARAAGFMLFTELEPAVLCPVSMTYAAMPALRHNAAIEAAWRPALTARAYDPSPRPWQAKAGLTLGMGMTEKQGGSDVRANTSRAAPDGEDAWGVRHRLTGHKWFFSAPQSDAHLVIAQADAGPTCFLLPRVLPEGGRNAVRLVRLKDKLGNRANASAEVEFDGALAWQVGEAGRGIARILEMGALTRLDCALGTAGLMRQALSLALDHARQRQAFGRPLLAHDLMRNVLADLALESEAACVLALRVAATLDRAGDPREAALGRLLTPVAKFWVCKRGAAFAQEAMECLGGNGYVEADGEGVMARIYREMPVNSIWEGASNLMALDLLRALRQPGAAEALESLLGPARGAHPALDAAIAALPARLAREATEDQARRLAQDLALAAQAALLWQCAPAPVALAFTASRLAQAGGGAFGLLPPGLPLDDLLARAMPH
ncbi:acyl-CoA dehydrogenase family protein [Ramlibacter sp. MAHUQ-53]|uniref:acyl-CoA dehydrogenase family protein n=1 Tax=unclassified Ramlibacter TaxID=2617605 RepID=UPI00362D42AB